MMQPSEDVARSAVPLRLGQLIASLSLATDLGTGQPIEHGLRTCLLSLELARRSGVGEDRMVEVYYLALLRFVGCTADASDTAELVGGDDIGFIAGMAPGFLGSTREQLRGLASSTGVGLPPLSRAGRTLRVLADVRGPQRAIAAHCDAAQHLSRRMGVEPGVTEALRLAFERWDGKGIPGEHAGEAVPSSVRVVQAARDIDLWVRIGGVASATEVIARRAGRAYDPAVAAAFTADPDGVLEAVAVPDPWQAALAAEAAPYVLVPAEQLTAILHAFADFADLKSPWFRGHSTAVASLAADAGRLSGCTPATVASLGHAGLLHDIGRVGVVNGIWDKAGALTLDEWERVRLHPYLTERILSRSDTLAPLARLAACHHERLDGSGYHRSARTGELSVAEQLLGAADAYQAMIDARPHRAPLSRAAAATELARERDEGRFSAPVVEAVLAAAGHKPTGRRAARPAGLTEREIEVLRRIARGQSNRQVASALVISTKTVGSHVEHIYTKAGVSTRAGAALFAMEHQLLDPLDAP